MKHLSVIALTLILSVGFTLPAKSASDAAPSDSR